MSIRTQLSRLTPFVWAFMLDSAVAAAHGTPVYVSGLLKRECQTCPSTIPPLCPECPTGQTCSLTIQTCDSCAQRKCVPDTMVINPNGTQMTRASPTGPIAGGVIAGFVSLAFAGFVLWRYLKTKKQAREAEAEKSAAFAASRAARASTHTVASMSSTTTRASNVIQIGYLPGVLNPSTPSTPGRSQFIPPVPPLPAGTTPVIRYPQSPEADEGTFFSADDILRASFCTTGDDPRSSVATTVYRNNAVVEPVAANVVRAGKAAVVTVKGGSNSASNTPHIGSGPVPDVPELDVTHYEEKVKPTSPAFSVGSTFLNRMSERTQSDSSGLNRPSNQLAVPRRPLPARTITAEEVIDSSAWEDESSDDDEKADIERMLTAESSPTSSASELHSPFSDRHSLSDIPLPAGTGLPPIMTSANRMSATVGISSTSSSRVAVNGSVINKSSREKSPFDDSNAVDRRR